MECDNISFSRTKYQKSRLILGLTFAVIMVGFLSAAECQAVTLTITATNGSVTATPDKADYNIGEIVELIPRPDTGYCFTGWSGDARGKRLVLNLTMDSDKAITAHFDTWQPPIGIPAPEFGIFETYRMYDEPANRNPALTYTQNAEGGYYTHYVDKDDPAATNTANVYGTVAKPRLTLPASPLPLGSIVEVHGGPYDGTPYAMPGHITGFGTVSQPIYVRGVATEGKNPFFVDGFRVGGTYLIFEGMSGEGCLIMEEDDQDVDTEYVSVRSCDFFSLDETGGKLCMMGAYVETDNTKRADNCVIYNNLMHNFGDMDYKGDSDMGGINVGHLSRYSWVVDNEVYLCTASGAGVRSLSAEYAYIGRNHIHDTRQSGIWVKYGTNITISQNTIHDIYPSYPVGGQPSPAIGYQLAPVNVWYIFNEIYDCSMGFVGQSSNDADPPIDCYLIGNLMYNQKHWRDWIYEHPDHNQYAAINWSGMKEGHIIGNTIYNFDSGMVLVWPESYTIIDNIISDVNVATYSHIEINANVSDDSICENNLFYQSEGSVRIEWGYGTYSTIEAFQAATSTGDNCLIGNPLFTNVDVNDFTLPAGSPAIDAGKSDGVVATVFDLYQSTFGVDIRKDIEGKPRTGVWDIGAYEYILSAVSDLSVLGTSQNSVTLSWTVPGDDGLASKPGRYDIRYSSSTLTEANWDAAAQVQGEPVPGDFGDEQSFTVTGLNPNTTYYIAIKTSNDTGSTTSPLSEVIEGTTAASGNHAPVLEPIGDQSVIENETLTFAISATDSDAGDTLTYSATNIPTGASFAPATQTFTWTPTSSQSGTYQVTFQVTDSHVTVPVSETITITVTGIQSTLTISSTSGGSTIPVEGSHSYDEGIPVSIQATAVDNYHFVNWTGTAVDAGKVANPNAASTTVTADADYTIRANFAIDQHTLTISSTSGGTVTTPGEGTYPYDHGTAASVEAAPEASYYFVNWTGTAVVAGQVDDPDSASTTVTMDADCTIQVNFGEGESDGIAPTVTNRLPNANDIQVPLNNLIILHVTDAGIGVKASSVIIRLDGDIIYTGGDTYYDSATGTCRRIGTIADYTYAYQSSQTFDFDESKTVTVNATDLGEIAMTEESYSFRTEMRSFGQNKQVDSTVEGLDKAAPSTARDSNGNIWAVWHAGPTDSRDIYVAKLSVNEEYFGGINKIRGSTSDQCNPVIAIGSDNKLYVAWQDNRQADDNNQGEWDIYVSTSVDGISWSPETRVNDPNNGNQVNPAIVIDSQNYAHVVWQDDRAGNQDICIATSSNGFATPTVSQHITFDTYDQVEPAIAADSGNTIYVVWTDKRNASDDIYGAASNNGPWTNVAIVNNANDQSSPAIAAESTGSILHLLWIEDLSGDKDIYYAATDGLQGIPLTGSNITDDTSGADQLDPTIAVTGSTDNNLKVFACWQDWRDADTDLYFAELSAGSGTNVFVDDGGSSANQGEPAIGICEYNHPYIMWADSRSTNTDIYFAGSTFIEPVALASELVTASASSSTTVGTDPQAITTLDDISIVVPAGACSYDVAITVTKIANPLAFAAPCLGGYDFGPSGIQFSQPVTITIPYAFSSSDSSVTPYWFNSLTRALSQQGITDIQDITISSSLHALSFKTTHFTAFYLLVGGGTAAIVGDGGGGCSISTAGEGNIVEFILPYIGLAVVMVILKMRDIRDRKARNITAGKC